MCKKTISNWGLYPKIKARVFEPKNYEAINASHFKIPIIARGNGRCYGDSALQKHIISTLKQNKFIAFDTKNGILKCEAGVLLSDILKVIVPKGFFLPVTPGTKFITVGGAVASNVHGKNHHKDGAFSNYIEELEILVKPNEIIKCSRLENVELFKETIGGMGLTGIIVTITMTLKPIETAFIQQKTIKAFNLDEILDYFETYKNYTYSVAWIDCLAKGKSMGRSTLILGEHAKKAELKSLKKPHLEVHSSNQLNIPFLFPNFTLNKYTISLFNALYYNKQLKKEVNKTVHYDSFFYPLDKLKNWNRIYGKKGFSQYQLVIPFTNGKEALYKILNEILNAGIGSFLAVLKTFGKKCEYASSLSFPSEGYTLALDFKISKKVFTLLERLDQIVLEYEGKLYLTKDSRMSKETFEKMYKVPRLNSNFKSLQYERLT